MLRLPDLAIEKTISLEDKILAILIPRAVVRIRIKNQPCVGHVLDEMKGVDGVDDDIVISADDQSRMVDVLEIGKTLTGL